MTIHRRTILKSIGLIGLAAAGSRLTPRLHAEDAPIPPFPPRWNGQPLGRVTSAYMNARVEPSTQAAILEELHEDDVVRVRRVVSGETVWWNNDMWLETDRGYLYASFVQPMWYHLPNPPRADLGEGRWAEVTVPYTDAYWDPDSRGDEDSFVSRMRYGSVHRIIGLVRGRDGKSWYKVKELYQAYFMRATHLLIIPPEDLTPLSPDVDPRDKRIEINLSDQTLIAYEGDTPVFAHHISSGLPDYPTPDGVHYVVDKRPSERMVGGSAASDEDYDLPGVPFVCYFTWEWAATHGCYWHNDWGRPRSHGCVNLPAYAARWIWRWTTPIADYDSFYVRPANALDGTKVIVRA